MIGIFKNYVKLTHVDFSKVTLIVSNVLSSHLPAINNFIISFFIIRYSSFAFWGEVAYYIISVQLVTVFINWGNKDYLLREFSANPSQMSQCWANNILSRVILLMVAFASFILFFPPDLYFIFSFWILAHFISRAFDPFIYFQKRFKLLLALDLFALAVVLISLVFYKENPDIYSVLLIFMLAAWSKAIILLLFFRKEFKFLVRGKIDLTLLKNSSAFFILTLIGILNARADIFCVNYLMNKEAVGYYQVISYFLLAVQGLAHLIIQPFAANLYRLNEKSLTGIQRMLWFSGLILIIIFLIPIYFILTQFYNIHFTQWMLLYSMLFCFPAYMYALIVYRLFKTGNQKWMVYVYLISITINVFINIFIIPYWGLTGVLFSGMFIEWLKLIVFLRLKNFILLKGNDRILAFNDMQ